MNEELDSILAAHAKLHPKPEAQQEGGGIDVSERM